MERITDTRSKGINRTALRTWALLLAIGGLVARGLIQNHMLGVGTATGQELLAMMEGNMALVTASLFLQVTETMAVPMFALLLAEGVEHTSDLKRYVLRVTAVAFLAEIPYDLLMHSRAFDMASQNPMGGLVLGLLVVHFFRMYEQKGMKNFMVKLLVVVMGVLWARMLRIDMGEAVVLLVWPMYAFRHKESLRNVLAAIMAMVCSFFSVFFVMAPFGCLFLHFYNGEKGEEEPPKALTYAAYPAAMLLLALAGMFLV